MRAVEVDVLDPEYLVYVEALVVAVLCFLLTGD